MAFLPASDVLPYGDVEQAAGAIAGVARRTPRLESTLLNEQLGCRLRIKAEPLQVTGSFKFRGAYNSIAAIPDEHRAAGVVAYSSGNHAQGVAAAAHLAGIPAAILMPEDAPATKIELTRAWGAEVITFNRYTDNREEMGRDLQAKRGATLIKPYDAVLTMAGQGTLAKEALEDCARDDWQVDAFLCPCGGGGLTAGCATAVEALSSRTQVFPVEPNGFDDTTRSLSAGTLLENDPAARSICDSLLAPTPGDLTFAVNRERTTTGLVVSDDEAMAAMAAAFKYLKLVVEPGGAVALAAVLTGKLPVAGRNLLVVCSGGNTDAGVFAQAIGRAAAQGELT